MQNAIQGKRHTLALNRFKKREKALINTEYIIFYQQLLSQILSAHCSSAYGVIRNDRKCIVPEAASSETKTM